MAQEVRSFSATIPPGTLITAPVSVAMTFPTRLVDTIEILVPPGPNGLVGFAIKAGGTVVIPYAAGQWIVANDETIRWPLEQQIESGQWALTGYNNGTYAHTLYVRFLLALPRVPPEISAPLPLAMLSGTL